MGARFRLKAGVDIATLNPQARIIAQAMKDYGLIVADNGSNFFFSGASASVDASNHQTLTWNDDDIQDTSLGLKSLHFSDFEVVDLTPTVTGLDVHNGSAGTTVTLAGNNFSNAAKKTATVFGAVGAYTFTATITDAGGLSVTSQVNVIVAPTFTSIAMTPATTTLAFGDLAQFTATALDQFGAALDTQPYFSW